MFGEATFLSLLDRQLIHQPGARACLVRHAGKQARLRLPLAAIAFRVTDDGGVTAADADSAIAAEILIAPDLLMALAMGDHTAMQRAVVTGDVQLAGAVAAALDQFDWALALRPHLGDIAATRAAQAISGLSAWRAQAQASAGKTLAEYATFEVDLLADRHAVRRFVDEVDTLRDDVARLEARLARLEDKASS
jgi:ubiquinone biosynthesis accessory factor UbiJ